MELGAADVRRAAAVASATLRALDEADWATPARELDLTARETLEHLVEVLLTYARHLATPVLYEPDGTEMALRCDPDTPVIGLVEGMRQVAAVIAMVVAAVPADTRAYHPWGLADRSGFAAMACDEILVHTDDIAVGLGSFFDPPADLCERVLDRLFPWAPADGSPWDRLRWANGRIAIPDHPRLGADWRWHCAPLEEWDGTVPAG